MASRIPWTTMSGEEVERVVAILICRMFNNAVPIRPSKGDRGIDLYVPNADGEIDVYQIKKYSSNLSAGQKRNIESSWNHLQKYLEESGKKMKSWYLVMPLNPTLENEDWLNQFTEGTSSKVFWKGLSFVDGWAASNPDVVDYYCFGGRNEIQEAISKFALSVQTPDPEDMLAWKKQLLALEDVLEKKNPNYAYSIHLLSELDNRNAITANSGIVVSCIEKLATGQRLVIDVFPKYQAAKTFAPISINIRFTPANDIEANQIQSHLDYGTPLERMPIEIESLGDLPIVRLSSVEEWLISSPGVDIGRKLECALVGNGDSLVFLQENLTSGPCGIRWKGTDENGIVSMTLDITYGESLKLKPTISIDSNDCFGKSLKQVERSLSFLESNACNSEMKLLINGEALTMSNFSSSNLSDEYISNSLYLIKLLSIIDIHACMDTTFPDLNKVHQDEVDSLERAVSLLANGTDICDWDYFKATLTENCSYEMPVLIHFSTPFTLDFSGEHYDFGFVQTTLIAESLELIGSYDDENNALFKPGSIYGQQLIRTHFSKNDVEIGDIGKMYIEEAPSKSEWEISLQSVGKPQ